VKENAAPIPVVKEEHSEIESENSADIGEIDSEPKPEKFTQNAIRILSSKELIQLAQDCELDSESARMQADILAQNTGMHPEARTFAKSNCKKMERPELYEQLRLVYLQNIPAEQKTGENTERDSKLLQSVEKQEKVLRELRKESRWPICKNCNSGVEMFRCTRYLLKAMTRYGLEYLIGKVYSSMERPEGECDKAFYAGIDLSESLITYRKRQIETPELFENDLRIAGESFRKFSLTINRAA
jgi:hypothetical protein